MAKWLWVILLGGVATFFVYKTSPAYTYIAGALTAIIAFLLWKKG